MPRISVILPVYNCEKFLQDALQSVLAQSFTDFEIIAINDGSTDRSGVILDNCTDARVKVIHQHNKGLALTLNVGISHASGEFIARQDADDFSMPERFAEQIAYFDQHPQCGLLGTHALIWKNNIKTQRSIRYASENIPLQFSGLFNCMFVHSSVMARTQSIVNAGMYPTDPQRNPPEDFDLWLRMMQHCDVANITKPLLIYREVESGITQNNKALIQSRTHHIASENIATILNEKMNVEIYSDLVATIRFDAARLSANPEWEKCYQAIDQLHAYFVRRFPSNSLLITRSSKQLQARLLTIQAGHRLMGKALLTKALGVARHIKKLVKQ